MQQGAARQTWLSSSACTLAALLAVFLDQPEVHAKDHRQAEVQVVNKTGRELEFVSVAHKYSDLYKNSQTWQKLPADGQTQEPLIVDYHTGFLTTGRDWWSVTWKFVGDDTVYMTSPKNFRAAVDALEGVVSEVPAQLGKVLGEDLAGEPGAVVGGQAGQELSGLLFNAEPTAGFKQHILRKRDSVQEKAGATLIVITESKVAFTSPSGTSKTGVAAASPK